VRNGVPGEPGDEVQGGEVVDEVPVDRSTARVYAEGWQSWSPATWYPVDGIGLAPGADWQHTMRFRPGTPVTRVGVQAEGVLVVDPGDGAPGRCYGAAGPWSVPTLRAALVDDRLVVRATADVVTSVHAGGGEAALAAYADWFARRAGGAVPGAPPTVWCSWYRYFEQVTSADVLENVRAMDAADLSVDVVQVDDGWSNGLGEGLHPPDRFGPLPALVDAIRSSGRRAGLWLAPFLVGGRTTLASEHPDWLVGPAGHNWGQGLAGLDLTHPAVRELLSDVLRRLVDLGFTYLKLDFLYGGAVPGPRHEDVTATEAYRSGLALVREVVGPDVYLVGCGAPLLPSVGLVDAMRVSPDTFHEGGGDGSPGLRGLMPLAARAWQQGRFWVNDPDCLVARPSFPERERWALAVQTYGGLPAFSDRVSELDAWGLRTVRDLLSGAGEATPFPPERLYAGARLARSQLAELGRVGDQT
jgi:alpha-galactosidase